MLQAPFPFSKATHKNSAYYSPFYSLISVFLWIFLPGVVVDGFAPEGHVFGVAGAGAGGWQLR